MTRIAIESVVQAQDVANALATALEPFGLEAVTLQDIEVRHERDEPRVYREGPMLHVPPPRLDTIAEITVRARVTRVPIAYPKVEPAPEDETTSDWHLMGVDPEHGGNVYARAGAGRRLEVFTPRMDPEYADLVERSQLDITKLGRLVAYPCDDGDEVLVLERDCS